LHLSPAYTLVPRAVPMRCCTEKHLRDPVSFPNSPAAGFSAPHSRCAGALPTTFENNQATPASLLDSGEGSRPHISIALFGNGMETAYRMVE
jgi:hypothetical protein